MRGTGTVLSIQLAAFFAVPIQSKASSILDRSQISGGSYGVETCRLELALAGGGLNHSRVPPAQMDDDGNSCKVRPTPAPPPRHSLAWLGHQEGMPRGSAAELDALISR